MGHFAESVGYSDRSCAEVRRGEGNDLTQRGWRAEHRMHAELLRRGIGDFTKDGGAACARGGGKIRGSAVEGFVSQDCESKSFLGVFGNAQLWRAHNLDLRKRCGHLRQDQRVVRAAAGDDELMDLGFGEDEAI